MGGLFGRQIGVDELARNAEADPPRIFRVVCYYFFDCGWSRFRFAATESPGAVDDLRTVTPKLRGLKLVLRFFQSNGSGGVDLRFLAPEP